MRVLVGTPAACAASLALRAIRGSATVRAVSFGNGMRTVTLTSVRATVRFLQVRHATLRVVRPESGPLRTRGPGDIAVL